VPHGLGGQRPAHEEPDVQRLRDLRVRRAQVEDLLDAVVDSASISQGSVQNADRIEGVSVRIPA